MPAHAGEPRPLRPRSLRWSADRDCLSMKCSGPPAPCKACASAGAENDCHFDPSLDLRRKVAVKRTIQELTDYKDLLESLLAAIRSSHPDKLHELTDIIRNDATMKEIALAVGSPVTKFTNSKALSAASRMVSDDRDQHMDLSFEEQLEFKSTGPSELDLASTSPEEEPHIESSRAALDPYARVTLESLCDIPLFNVPAKPWTEVTDDRNLVSHLVSLYFTWDHPCGQVVDQRVFLDHMKRGDLDSEFCTPLLVNSLLSMASVRRPLGQCRELLSDHRRSILTALMSFQTRRICSLVGMTFSRKQNACGLRNEGARRYQTFRRFF